MKYIHKGREPVSLTQHRTSAHADYANYSDKQTLRALLVNEQRGLCCYCLSRIRGDSQAMKIAHWHSRTKHPTEQLEYANLLAACKGNEGAVAEIQNCDTCQGNRDLSRNPANAMHRVEEFIHYEGDGRIVSHDRLFDVELNGCVKLPGR